MVVGGGYNKEARWVEPTILVDVPKDGKVMTEETFGPILPILNVDSPSEAIDFINERLDLLVLCLVLPLPS